MGEWFKGRVEDGRVEVMEVTKCGRRGQQGEGVGEDERK